MNQLNDLDNNLVADEFSSFDSTTSRTSTGFTVISKPLTPIISPTITPRSSTQPTNEPVSQPRTPTVSTMPTVNLNNAPITETIISAPRPNPYTTPAPTTEPEEAEQPTYDQPIFGGGGGGGSAMRTSEEVVEEMPVVVEKKILGMKPKLFYSLLVLASVGGYFYFKSKSNLKSK